ncbi:serine/threonine-protein kinase [Kitasatospora sp. NPDC057015]|uniref:serine/threonine-protein kinase n=1 Tax=Kitasatospora sp. NPDC057015 TaxID=3346001 RepID=UPI003632FE3F
MLARIGEGGMGSVYLTRTRGRQPVALKVIRREYAQDAEFRRRFQQEARAARQVRGYHVVPVVDHDTTGEQPWIATAFVPGLPLDEVLRAFGPLPVAAALQLAGCAAEALRAVHAAGVIHRDLKPSNILIGPEGPSVIDFGIARAADATQLTRSGGLIGTPQYMSPEHADGQPLTPATDVFSLGLVMAVTATGRHPYGEGGAITLATKIANTEARPPDLSGYQEPLRQLLERCLAPHPDDRPSPAELAELCEQASGRPLRDFTGWLPEPIAAAIARRERASEELGDPSGDPTSLPTGHQQAPSQYPAQPTGAPSRPYPGPASQGTSPSYPVPGLQGAPQAPAPAARRRRTPALAAAGLAAVVLVAGTAWVLGAQWGKDAGAKNAQGAPPPAASATSAGSGPSAGSPSPAGSVPSGKAGGKATAKATGEYQMIFKKPFTLRSPATAGFSRTDLDTPQVVSISADISDNEMEIVYQDAHSDQTNMSFRTAFGISSGETASECRSGVGADALSPNIRAKEMKSLLTPGTVLCTVTSKGNLAMMKILEVAENGTAFDYTTELTLWAIP